MSESQMLGLVIHVTVALAFFALSLKTRLAIRLAHLTIALVNLGGIARILLPAYANQIELYGLFALFIPFGIGMWAMVQLLGGSKQPSGAESL